jgi:YggT family protein
MRHYFPISILVDIVFSIVEFLLLIRIILKFFGANPQTPFVAWVYDTTQPVLAPFIGIFPNQVLRNGFVLELSTLFALLVYGFLAYLISEIINMIEFKDKEKQK